MITGIQMKTSDNRDERVKIVAYYYVCEMSKDDVECSELTLNVKDKISREELDDLNNAFGLTGAYYSATSIKEIVVDNGIEFKKWMMPANLQSCLDRGMSSSQLVMGANKHVLNYASSIKTFVDMTYRLLTKKQPSKADDFEQLTHTFYDKHSTYRFWANFRNYVVHCAFPYTVFHNEVDKECQVLCKKGHLLEFNNWKHSKADIEKMPEDIDLTAMVDDMSGLVVALYLQFLYYLAEDAFHGYEYYQAFLRRHQVKRPVILEVDEQISEETGFVNPSMHPLPVEIMVQMFQTLQNHPSVKINFIEEKE